MIESDDSNVGMERERVSRNQKRCLNERQGRSNRESDASREEVSTGGPNLGKDLNPGWAADFMQCGRSGLWLGENAALTGGLFPLTVRKSIVQGLIKGSAMPCKAWLHREKGTTYVSMSNVQLGEEPSWGLSSLLIHVGTVSKPWEGVVEAPKHQ
jgi:hypothetical protein